VRSSIFAVLAKTRRALQLPKKQPRLERNLAAAGPSETLLIGTRMLDEKRLDAHRRETAPNSDDGGK